MTEGTQVRVIGTDRVGTVVKIDTVSTRNHTSVMIAVPHKMTKKLYWYDVRELEVVG